MLTSLFMLLVSTTPVQADRDAVDVFVEGCVRGSLTLPRGDGRSVSRIDYPVRMRPADRSDARETYYKLQRPADTWMVVTEYSNPKKSGLEKSCQITTETVGYEDAVQRLTKLLYPNAGDQAISPTQTMFTSYVPQYRYRLDVERGDDFTVMRTTLLDEAAAAREAAKQAR